MPVDGPRMVVSGVTASAAFDAASRGYDQIACRLGSLMNTRSCSASTTTLCSVGYGSETTRVGGTSPPAIVADCHSGQACGAASACSTQPFSYSSASSVVSSSSAVTVAEDLVSAGGQ